MSMQRGITIVFFFLTWTASAQESCPTPLDADQDGLIGINDMLNLLSVFGDTDMDFDGIWDSVDDCVGDYDECGLCNGPGPQIPIVETITTVYDSVYAQQIDEWWVFEVGSDTTFSLVCEIIPGCTDSSAVNYSEEANVNEGCVFYNGCSDQNSINYYGKSYNLVEINGQCWLQSNLETAFFRDGSPIAQVSADNWQDLNDNQTQTLSIQYPAYCIPPCDNSCASNGYLYNYFVWNSESEVCPTGFRMPERFDFEYLINPYLPNAHLGELKSPSGWNGNVSYATNSSGFSAVGTGTLGASWSGSTPQWNGSNSYTRFAFKNSCSNSFACETLLLAASSSPSSNTLTPEIATTSRAIRCIKE